MDALPAASGVRLTEGAVIPPQATWRVKEPTRTPLEPRLGGLLEEGSDAIPVRVTIVQDGLTTGWDDGALGFEDDSVWFSGRATSFYLGAPDLRPGTYRLSRHEAVTHSEALQGLPLRHPTRDVWVMVTILTSKPSAKVDDERRYIQGVKRLRGSTEGEGSREYPPLMPRPGLIQPPKKRRRDRVLLMSTGVCCLVIVTYRIFFGPHRDIVSELVFFYLPFVAFLRAEDSKGDHRLRRFVEDEKEAIG